MLHEHWGYVADHNRLALYRSAISKVVVTRHSAVADLGCGSGILGLLCLQAGAKRIYAIDDSAMIAVARETFTRAGFNDHAVCLHGRSSQIELPEQVDVVICDHVGYFGFDYGVVEFLQDARRRFLKPGGTLVPSRIRLHVSAVGSKECAELANGWNAQVIPPEFHWVNTYSINAKHAVNLVREDIVCPAATLGEIDLRVDNPDFLSWKTELRAARDGVVNGIAGWFECELADGIWMTNSPLAEQPIRRPQAFLPIGEPTAVNAGDLISVTIMARPAEHLVAWTVTFHATGKRFSHSTWEGMLLSPEHLIRANPGRVPKLNREGMARLAVLAYCDGSRTAREIEQAVLQDHPDLFPSPAEISHFVHRVLGRDTE